MELLNKKLLNESLPTSGVEEKEVILRVKHLKQFFRYGRGIYKYTKAVHDISFDVYRGEVFGLVGESGCGKTTTGRSIIKLYKITSGDVWFKGVRIGAGTRWNEKEIKFTNIRLKKALKELSQTQKEKIKAIKASFNEEVEEEKAKAYQSLNEDYKDVVSYLESKTVVPKDLADEYSIYQRHVKEIKTATKNYDNELINSTKYIQDLYSKVEEATNEKQDDLAEVIATIKDKKAEKVNEAKYICQNQRELIKKARSDNDYCNKKFAQGEVDKVVASHKEFLDKYEELKKSGAPILEDIQKEYDAIKLEIKQAKKARITSKMQMIFQDPIASLNPRMNVGEIIAEGLVINGEKDKTKIRAKVAEMLELVGLLPEHMNRYPHEFSGGQRQRIGIARALIMNPELIIADEPVSALDVSIQAQVINLLNDLRKKFGLTILFIAHNLSVVKYFCDRIAVMYYGKIVELTTSDELFAHPLHPYTKSLLSAVPTPDPNQEKERVRVKYNPATAHNYSKQGPTLKEIVKGHFVLCNDEEEAIYLRELSK